MVTVIRKEQQHDLAASSTRTLGQGRRWTWSRHRGPTYPQIDYLDEYSLFPRQYPSAYPLFFPKGAQATWNAGCLCVLVVWLISFQLLLTFPSLKHPPPLARPPPTTTAHHPLFHLLLPAVRTKPDDVVESLVALATSPTVSMRTTWYLRGHRHENQSSRTTAPQIWYRYIAILTNY